MDEAQVPLVDSVGIAETSVADSRAIKAQLDVSTDAVYAVGALATGELSDVRVDIVDGTVLSTRALGRSNEPCPGSISLTDTIAIAEAEKDGQAVSVGPDDDNACNREVQVLADILWEVKVAPDGAVLETEESDAD